MTPFHEEPEQLRLETSLHDRVAHLDAAGELDVFTSPRLVDLTEQLCATHSVDEIVVDGAGLSFVDSAGLRALVLAHSTAEGAGIELRVGEASKSLLTLLTMTGLDRLLRS